MSKVTINIFEGDNWLGAVRLPDVPPLRLFVVPRVGEVVEIRDKEQLVAAFAVSAVRHAITDGEHEVDLLWTDPTAAGERFIASWKASMS